MARWSELRTISLGQFAKQFASNIRTDRTFGIAAELAFWSVLSIFPFAIFLLTLMGYLPIQGAEEQLMTFIYKAIPHDTASLVVQTIHQIAGRQKGWLLVLSVLGALWWASGTTSAAITALNRAYRVEETRPAWRAKLLALAVTAGAAMLIAFSTAAFLLGPDLAQRLSEYLGVGTLFAHWWSWARWIAIVVSLMTMLSLVYFILPNVRQRSRAILPGAVTAVLLEMAATWLFKLYVSNFGSYGVMYGALGTVVVLMMWLYILCAVILVGGELNALLDRTLLGVRHVERASGPVTREDRGASLGRQAGLQRQAKSRRRS